jgi:phycobilisome rod-core linker protein
MAIPLLQYKPSSQNQRVPGYEVPNEDTPRIYRIEDYAFTGEVEELSWAAYRQLFSEHVILKFYRQGNLESQLKNKAITVRDFVRGLAKSQAFDDLVIKTNSNYRLVEIALKRLLGRAPYNKEEEIAWSIKIATNGWDGFVDALVDSEEYQNSFGENIIPYQSATKIDPLI